MGMFDEYVTRCRDCGEEVVFQTKAGPCRLTRYDQYSVTKEPTVAGALDGQTEFCDCGRTVTIHAQVIVSEEWR